VIGEPEGLTLLIQKPPVETFLNQFCPPPTLTSYFHTIRLIN